MSDQFPRHILDSYAPDRPRNTSRVANGFVGLGPRNYKRTDDRIRDDISDRLTEDARIDASDVEVEVNHGEVMLSGTVNDRDQKQRAAWLAERVFGVRQVLNAIRLTQGQATARTPILERHRA